MDLPGAFPPGPSPDHPTVPIARGWRVAGSVIGIVAIAFVATVLLAEREPGPDYRTVELRSLESGATDPPRVTEVRVQIDPEQPRLGRVRVSGDQLVRVDLAGAALCAPVSGAPGAWIDLELCAALDRLVVTASDIDEVSVTAVARF